MEAVPVFVGEFEAVQADDTLVIFTAEDLPAYLQIETVAGAAGLTSERELAAGWRQIIPAKDLGVTEEGATIRIDADTPVLAFQLYAREGERGKQTGINSARSSERGRVLR